MRISVCVCVCVYGVHVYQRACASMCRAFVHLSICPSVHLSICLHTHTHTHARTHTHTHTQVDSGAQVIQVFDSWAGHLSPRYSTVCLCACVRVHASACVCMHVCMYGVCAQCTQPSGVCVYMCYCMPACVHVCMSLPQHKGVCQSTFVID